MRYSLFGRICPNVSKYLLYLWLLFQPNVKNGVTPVNGSFHLPPITRLVLFARERWKPGQWTTRRLLRTLFQFNLFFSIRCLWIEAIGTATETQKPCFTFSSAQTYTARVLCVQVNWSCKAASLQPVIMPSWSEWFSRYIKLCVYVCSGWFVSTSTRMVEIQARELLLLRSGAIIPDRPSDPLHSCPMTTTTFPDYDFYQNPSPAPTPPETGIQLH